MGVQTDVKSERVTATGTVVIAAGSTALTSGRFIMTVLYVQK